MALQEIPGGMIIPKLWDGPSAGLGYGSLLLDAASEKAAYIVRAPKTGTISKVGFRTGTVTTGATVDVRLETVNLTTGDPSGTLFGTNTNGSQIIADTDDNMWFLTTLTAGASVTKGALIALVIVNPAASFGNLNISMFGDQSIGIFPYNDLYTTVWAKSNNSPIMVFEYSDGSYTPILGAYPYSALSSVAYNIDTVAQDEVALKFKLAFPAQISGCLLYITLGADMDVVLYDSDGTTVLTSISLDVDVKATTAAEYCYISFPSSISLSKDTFYYLSLKPTTVTNITAYTMDAPSVAAMGSMDGGVNFYYSSRVGAGAWSDVTTRMIAAFIILDKLDDGVGGGGMLVHSGMTGGLNG